MNAEFKPLFVPADYGLIREGEYLYRIGSNQPLEFLGFEPASEDCIMVRDSWGSFFIGKISGAQQCRECGAKQAEN